MPIVGTATSHDPRRASHADDVFTPNGIVYNIMDMGNEPWCIVVADVSTAIHNQLAAFADVRVIPDLDTTVGAQVGQVQTLLEEMNIPAGWVAGGQTYRTVIRVVAAMFQFLQVLQGRFPNVRLFDTGVTLATRFNQLPAGVRSNLQDVAASLGYDTSSLVGSSTIRVILKAMADQWRQTEIYLGPITV
jgi:hypothetical protein